MGGIVKPQNLASMSHGGSTTAAGKTFWGLSTEPVEKLVDNGRDWALGPREA
jgi:hypothetical protein